MVATSEKARFYLPKVALSNFANKYPSQLSGSMRDRAPLRFTQKSRGQLAHRYGCLFVRRVVPAAKSPQAGLLLLCGRCLLQVIFKNLFIFSKNLQKRLTRLFNYDKTYRNTRNKAYSFSHLSRT